MIANERKPDNSKNISYTYVHNETSWSDFGALFYESMFMK